MRTVHAEIEREGIRVYCTQCSRDVPALASVLAHVVAGSVARHDGEVSGSRRIESDETEYLVISVMVDNVGSSKLHAVEYMDFCKEYPEVKIAMKKTDGIYHDRFIVLDYGTDTERIFCVVHPLKMPGQE